MSQAEPPLSAERPEGVASDSSAAGDHTGGPGKEGQMNTIMFNLLHTAKALIENYELDQANQTLQLAATIGGTNNAAYLHLVC